MTKRVLSLLLTLVMVLSLCVPAIAAEDFEAEAPAEVVEEAPAAPVEPEAPEAEEPVEEPAVEEPVVVDEPEAAAIAADEPVGILMNVPEAKITELNDLIAKAQAISPEIGTKYCIQDSHHGSFSATSSLEADHGKTRFDAELDKALLLQASIKDNQADPTGAKTNVTEKMIQDEIDALKPLVDAAKTTVDQNEINLVKWSSTQVAASDTTTLANIPAMINYSGGLDGFLDAMRAEVDYTTTMDEYWTPVFQPEYRTKLADAVSAANVAAEAAVAGTTDHATLFALYNAVKVLSPGYANAAAGITTANNEYAKAKLADADDISALQAAVKVVKDAKTAAGKDYSELDAASDSALAGLVTQAKAKTKFNNNWIETFISVADAAITAGKGVATLEEVNQLLFVADSCKIRTVPYNLALYSVSPATNVTPHEGATQSNTPDLSFTGFTFNIQKVDSTVNGVEADRVGGSGGNPAGDAHVYYVEYQLGSNTPVVYSYNTNAIIFALDSVDGSIGWSNVTNTDAVMHGTAGTGTLEYTAPINVRFASPVTSGTLKVTLYGGWLDEENKKVVNAKKIGETQTIQLNGNYAGPEIYAAGYIPEAEDAPALGFDAADLGNGTMYIALDRLTNNKLYTDATVYLTSPDGSVKLYKDISDETKNAISTSHGDLLITIPVSSTSDVLDTTTGNWHVASTDEAASNIKLVPGNWTVDLYVNFNKTYSGPDVALASAGATEKTGLHRGPVKLHVDAVTASDEWAEVQALIAKAEGYADMAYKKATATTKAADLTGEQSTVKTKLAALEAAIADAAKMPNDNKSRTAIQGAAYTDLKTALGKLIKAGDYSALEALITTAKALKEANYTNVSWYDWTHDLTAAIAEEKDGGVPAKADTATAMTALEWAEAVVKNHVYGTDRQLYIDRATRQFQLFLDKLVPANGALAAAKEALNAAIAKAEGLNEKDYTEATWKALEDALKAADSAVTLEQIEAATAGIEAAINGLEKVKPQNVLPTAPAGWSGWKQDTEGNWYYFRNGEMKKNYWVTDASAHDLWYHVGADGKMDTGFKYITDKTHGAGWFMLQAATTNGMQGAALTGWQATGSSAGDGYFEPTHNGHYAECTWTKAWGDYSFTTKTWTDGQQHVG